MIGFFRQLFGGGTPRLSDATTRDANAIAALHAAAFRRGWSEEEVETMLADRAVIAHRANQGRQIAGFVMSRQAADEAEILSIAVARRSQGRGLARQLLILHLRRLAALGTRTVFLEVDERNKPAISLYMRAGFREVARRPNYYPHPDGKTAAALVLRRDLA
jgi:ribosomal-protein-alanine N-acetyltransferase